MNDFTEDIAGTVERARTSRQNSFIALVVSLSATFMALCHVKDNNVVQAMAQAEANAVDAWSYYQAKSTKQNLAEGMVDHIALQRDTAAGLTDEGRALLDRKMAEYADRAKQYDAEKLKIKRSAEDFQRDYGELNRHDDQFDMAEASLSLGIAVLGVTALTQKSWLLALGMVFTAIGVVLGVSGFMGYNLHPDFLAKLLG